MNNLNSQSTLYAVIHVPTGSLIDPNGNQQALNYENIVNTCYDDKSRATEFRNRLDVRGDYALSDTRLFQANIQTTATFTELE